MISTICCPSLATLMLALIVPGHAWADGPAEWSKEKAATYLDER